MLVWTESTNVENKMNATLCAIKELKSNLDAAWNHRGDKFCVGASSGHVFVGSYNDVVGFWVAISQTEEPPLGKPLHKASVVCTRFDPGSGRVVASASADGQVIISSSYEETLDSDGTGPFAGVTDDAGEIIFKLKSTCWVNTLAFSPSGSTLVYATHDCELHFVEFTPENVASREKPKSKRVLYNGMPILCGLFVSENSYVGCGYDNAPLLFKKETDGSWVHAGSLDPGLEKVKAAKIGKDAFGGRTVMFDGVKQDGDLQV